MAIYNAVVLPKSIIGKVLSQKISVKFIYSKLGERTVFGLDTYWWSRFPTDNICNGFAGSIGVWLFLRVLEKNHAEAHTQFYVDIWGLPAFCLNLYLFSSISSFCLFFSASYFYGWFKSSRKTMAAPTITQKDTTFTKIFVGGLPYHTTGKLLFHFVVNALSSLKPHKFLSYVFTHSLQKRGFFSSQRRHDTFPSKLS